MDGASRQPVRSDMVERYKLKEETSFVARHQTLSRPSAVTPQHWTPRKSLSGPTRSISRGYCEPPDRLGTNGVVHMPCGVEAEERRGRGSTSSAGDGRLA